jgi:hypothetical protein
MIDMNVKAISISTPVALLLLTGPALATPPAANAQPETAPARDDVRVRAIRHLRGAPWAEAEGRRRPADKAAAE